MLPCECFGKRDVSRDAVNLPRILKGRLPILPSTFLCRDTLNVDIMAGAPAAILDYEV